MEHNVTVKKTLKEVIVMVKGVAGVGGQIREESEGTLEEHIERDVKGQPSERLEDDEQSDK